MSLTDQLKSAKSSVKDLLSLDSKAKADLISCIADCLSEDRLNVLNINQAEVETARENGFEETQLDRLLLTDDRYDAILESVRNVADLEDPVGETIEQWSQPSGINIKKVRVPLGVVGVIYENRPNVTVDAAVICLKSSNVSVLRGSSAALNTNRRIIESMHRALNKCNVNQSIVTFIDDESREGAINLMEAKGLIDVLIPRGGPSLIKAIQDNAKVPFILDGAGNCHVYVDKDADLDMAEKIVVNSKTQRSSVCNAAESLVVHRDVAKEFISRISGILSLKNVRLVGDSCSVDFGDGHISPASEADFATEFLDLKMSVAVVESIEGAINHVNKYSSLHTECIVTDNPEAAEKFMRYVDSAVVMHNTSTRFTDGERFGFGAEIGISTQKLHARGPMALREITTYQYQVVSNGAVV